MRRVLTIILLSTVMGLGIVGSAQAFTDVPTSHPFAKAIHDLSVRGIIGGYDDGTFRPDALVTRQQFAKMIVGALYLPVSTSDICPFTDVDVSAGDELYPDHYVAVAAANDITKGYSATSFKPGKNIHRAHVITMVVRALERLYPGALEPYSAPGFVPGDWDELSGEHLNNAKLAYHNGLLDGLDYWGEARDPMTPMPRGEVAQVLYNMKDLLPDVEMSYAWGETVEFEGMRISVSGPAEDPGDQWLQPDPGNRYVAFAVSAQNIGAVPITINPYDFRLRDSAGHSFDDVGYGTLGEGLHHTELQPGELVEAWRVFEIPSASEVDSVVYDPSFTDVALLVWQ